MTVKTFEKGSEIAFQSIGAFGECVLHMLLLRNDFLKVTREIRAKKNVFKKCQGILSKVVEYPIWSNYVEDYSMS